jgi:hypothetical protein
MSGTKKNPEENRRRELLELEHAFWNAMKVRDGKTAAKLTDQTTIVVGPQGIGEIDKTAVGDMIENADWKLERFQLDPDKLKVKMVDDDVALIAYEVEERLVVGGQAQTLRAFDTSVWVRKLGKWVCAMHTETLAGDPYGRDRVAKQVRA